MDNKFVAIGCVALLCIGVDGLILCFSSVPKEYTHHGAIEYNMQHMTIIEEKLDSLEKKMDSLYAKVNVVGIKGKNDE